MQPYQPGSYQPQPYQPQAYQPQPYQPGPGWPSQPAFPPPPAPGKKGRGGRTAVLIVVIVLLVCAGAPSAALGIRYANLETGPHQALPNACTAMDGKTFKDIVGTGRQATRRQPVQAGSSLTDGCAWHAPNPKKDSQVEVAATLYKRTFWSSSVGSAGDGYQKLSVDKRREQHQSDINGGIPAQSVVSMNGAGQEGFCWGADHGGIPDFYCAVRDGNVVLELSVTPPHPATGTALLPNQLNSDLVDFVSSAKDLANDFLQNLS